MSVDPSVIFGKFTPDTPAFVLKEAMLAIQSPLAENINGTGEEMCVRRRAASLALQKYNITSKGDLLHFLFPSGVTCGEGRGDDYMAKLVLCQTMCLEDVSDDCSNIPNERVLWRICYQSGVTMRYNSTKEELIYQLQMVKRKRKHVNVQDIPNILSNLDDISWLISRISPTNPEEAICLSAKRFKCNILRAKNPIIVYHALNSNDEETIARYLPLWKDNPHYLSTDNYFVPELSVDFYDIDTLINMSHIYGLEIKITDSEYKDSLYSALSDAQRSNNIYPGNICREKSLGTDAVMLKGEFMEIYISISSLLSALENSKELVFDGISLTERNLRQIYQILERRFWSHYPKPLPDEWISDRCKVKYLLGKIKGISLTSSENIVLHSDPDTSSCELDNDVKCSLSDSRSCELDNDVKCSLLKSNTE